MKNTILFDLDGTLTDPGVGITNSVMYALAHSGIHVQDRRELYGFIGPPLVDSFRRYYGFSQEQAVEAVRIYRVYFADKGIFENELYPGVPQMLETLRDAGLRLAVATSKPEEFAAQILAHFKLDGYFELLAGNTLREERPTKGEVVAYALQLLRARPEQTLMVGDREHDVLGAAAHGVDTVGVLYGYGSRGELERAGARHIAADVDELTQILLREQGGSACS